MAHDTRRTQGLACPHNEHHILRPKHPMSWDNLFPTDHATYAVFAVLHRLFLFSFPCFRARTPSALTWRRRKHNSHRTFRPSVPAHLFLSFVFSLQWSDGTLLIHSSTSTHPHTTLLALLLPPPPTLIFIPTNLADLSSSYSTGGRRAVSEGDPTAR